MANLFRGEVELQAGDRTVVLRLGITSLILLEAEFGGESIPQIMQDRFSNPARLLVTDMHKLFWAAMQRRDEPVSREEVGYIMEDAGLQACGLAVAELLAATFQAPDEAPAENPQKASQDSTGAK